MSIEKQHKPYRFGFLATPGFSLIAYAAAIDIIRIANHIKGIELYTWDTISIDDMPVKASNGVEIKPSRNLLDQIDYEILFVCGGTDTPEAWRDSIGEWLREKDRNGVKLGSLCAGTYFLAKAGLLAGCRCTIHWEDLSSTRKEFPDLQLTDDIYEIDRNRYTCSGGAASIDMFLHIVSLHHGQELAVAISESFLVDHIRDTKERQSIPLLQLIGEDQPVLLEAINLMEANIEDPLSIDELCTLVKVSRRQLEYLFKNQFNCTAKSYYMRLRLRNARRLILQTEISILDISKLCGFVTAPHFSKTYRNQFGLPPRDERRLLLTRPEPSAETTSESSN